MTYQPRLSLEPLDALRAEADEIRHQGRRVFELQVVALKGRNHLANAMANILLTAGSPLDTVERVHFQAQQMNDHPIEQRYFEDDLLGPIRKQKLRVALAAALHAVQTWAASEVVHVCGTTRWSRFCDFIRYELGVLNWTDLSVIRRDGVVDFLLGEDVLVKVRRSDGDGRPGRPMKEIVDGDREGENLSLLPDRQVVHLLYNQAQGAFPDGSWSVSLLDEDGEIIWTTDWAAIRTEPIEMPAPVVRPHVAGAQFRRKNPIGAESDA